MVKAWRHCVTSVLVAGAKVDTTIKVTAVDAINHHSPSHLIYNIWFHPVLMAIPVFCKPRQFTDDNVCGRQLRTCYVSLYLWLWYTINVTNFLITLSHAVWNLIINHKDKRRKLSGFELWTSSKTKYPMIGKLHGACCMYFTTLYIPFAASSFQVKSLAALRLDAVSISTQWSKHYSGLLQSHIVSVTTYLIETVETPSFTKRKIDIWSFNLR